MKRFALVALVAGCAGATPPVVLTGRAEPSTPRFTSLPTVTAQLATYERPHAGCDPRDSANLCVASTVVARVGRILGAVHHASCGDAARSLDRYADLHSHDIDTLFRLSDLEPAGLVAQWQDRQRGAIELALVAAFDLGTRCEHDDRVGRALHRIGFTTLISDER